MAECRQCRYVIRSVSRLGSREAADAWWLGPAREQDEVPKPIDLTADQIRAAFSGNSKRSGRAKKLK
jgi:hypothetical protein